MNAPAQQPDPQLQSQDPVQMAFALLRETSRRDPFPSAEDRIDRLDRLVRLLQSNQEAIRAAVSADFSHRAPHETTIADIFATIETARHARRHLRAWMAPRSVRPSALVAPAGARIEFQPLGVVGIISPWNYPVNLALGPLACALAAGNRALIKPSELTPRTAALLEEVVASTYSADEVAVVTGGPEVAAAVSRLPLDHLIFTGSTRVGRIVARAAAENLVPVTLELGGKSPVIVHPSHDLGHAAERVAVGKLFNAGQTCIAPDYVFVPRARESEFVDGFRAAVSRLHPAMATSSDYTALASEAGLRRMNELVVDARSRGAVVESILPGGGSFPEGTRKFAPVIVRGPTPDMRVMQEEIFGPILPVMTYDDMSEAIDFVNERPRPLALYYFDPDARRAADVMRRTVSGGACLNDTILHFAQDNLPFGGVGESGVGAYHGVHGFEAFSHRKGIYVGTRAAPSLRLLAPPYTRLLDRALAFLIGGSR